jgi:hypothetical protein
MTSASNTQHTVRIQAWTKVPGTDGKHKNACSSWAELASTIRINPPSEVDLKSVMNEIMNECHGWTGNTYAKQIIAIVATSYAMLSAFHVPLLIL